MIPITISILSILCLSTICPLWVTSIYHYHHQVGPLDRQCVRRLDASMRSLARGVPVMGGSEQVVLQFLRKDGVVTKLFGGMFDIGRVACWLLFSFQELEVRGRCNRQMFLQNRLNLKAQYISEKSCLLFWNQLQEVLTRICHCLTLPLHNVGEPHVFETICWFAEVKFVFWSFSFTCRSS